MKSFLINHGELSALLYHLEPLIDRDDDIKFLFQNFERLADETDEYEKTLKNVLRVTINV